MKPETAGYFLKAREFLVKATGMLDQGWPDEAGRCAYLAGFHAAQALIFEQQDRSMKTHGGVQSEFAQLVRSAPEFDPELRRFLGRAYAFKAIADYEIGSDLQVTNEKASETIAVAGTFVDAVWAMLPRP